MVCGGWGLRDLHGYAPCEGFDEANKPEHLPPPGLAVGVAACLCCFGFTEAPPWGGVGVLIR